MSRIQDVELLMAKPYPGLWFSMTHNDLHGCNSA